MSFGRGKAAFKARALAGLQPHQFPAQQGEVAIVGLEEEVEEIAQQRHGANGGVETGVDGHTGGVRLRAPSV